LSLEDKNWLLYLKILEAENWAVAAIYHDRLTKEQKQRPDTQVTRAISALVAQAKEAEEAGLPVLAEMRLALARKCQEDLPNESKVHIPMLATPKEETPGTQAKPPATVTSPSAPSTHSAPTSKNERLPQNPPRHRRRRRGTQRRRRLPGSLPHRHHRIPRSVRVVEP